MMNDDTPLDSAIYIADLAERAPLPGVSRGAHHKGRWLAIPCEAGAVAGTMLWIGPETQPNAVRIVLGRSGWHGIFIAICSLEDETENGIRVDLSGDPCYAFLRRERREPLLIEKTPDER